ncbi:hypothetical protein [Portibacter marinus]|uniref:hypothetical protein n=1 Tax=Portibacter marinus TaxID=2898660 RepID=UPI001F293C42|nr:hypothetical protein [Portibacter marinus]
MNISKLLERYFEGETSLEEERSLKAYFACDEVAEEHQIYKDLFSFYAEEAQIECHSEDSIDLLLEKYFDGETELSEEQRLRDYFSSNEVKEAHEIYEDLFVFFADEAEIVYQGEDSIDLLLEKYFAGESSIAEEQRLKAYFNSEEVLEDHRQYSDLFGYFSTAQTEVLEKNIDLSRGRTLHIVRRTMVGIAATLTILLGSLYVMNLNQQGDLDNMEMTAMEEQEAEEALETTMEALAYLGVHFNKGTESLEQIKKLKKTEIFKN